MITPIKDFQKEFNKMVADGQKAVRQSIYQTLEITAEKSRNAVIANYPKAFKDKNGIRKNKGIPKMTSKSKVDKKNLSISLGWGQKQGKNFMDDNEFGGERTGARGGSRPMPSLELQKMGRTSSGKMKQGLKISKLMSLVKKHENKRSKEKGTPKPFMMKTKSGHHMLVRRNGKSRDSILGLYHFDKKVQVRPRWNFMKTVEGVTVHTLDKTLVAQLEKNLSKIEK